MMENFKGNTSSHHGFPDGLFDDDLTPIVIKPYLALCRRCGRTFPYHPVLFTSCPELDCESHQPRWG
jgi:hypothetical protein